WELSRILSPHEHAPERKPRTSVRGQARQCSYGAEGAPVLRRGSSRLQPGVTHRETLVADRHAPPGGAERTLYVLAVLARHGQPLCVADLAGLTGLAVSTLYRQLALLKHWGFVQENAGAYAPGPTCLQLAWGFDQTSWLVRET